MTEHAHPVLPLTWIASDAGPAAHSGAVPLPAGAGADGAVPAIAAVCAQALRYSGGAEFELMVSFDDDPWFPIAAHPRTDRLGAGARLADCRQLVEKALAGRPAGPAAGRLRVVVGPADERDRVTFEFRGEDAGPWSLEVHARCRPADPAGLDRLAEHCRAFVDRTVTAADTPVGAVRYLTAAEGDLLARLNATDRPLPERRCIHELVDAAADRWPDNLAVLQGQVRLSYRELDEKANALAERLAAGGVARGARVALLAGRSAEFVVAALAVLKAGAAYVPLDPLLPLARLTTLHRIGAAGFLLAERQYADIAAGLTRSWTALPAAPSMDRTPRRTAPLTGVTGADLAYLICTSGSSGEPKAVLLDHAGRANMIADLNERFALTPADRTLVVSSPSFDMSVYDIFGTLAAGATVVLPRRGRENDAGHWAELVRQEKVTVWHSVPSSLSLFLNLWTATATATATGSREAPLRLVVAGGDWIPVGQPQRVRTAFPHADFYSLGGATEVSVDSVVHRVTRQEPHWRSIPYGTALDNQTAYVVDAHGELAAVDQIGELVLGGAGVAWGYDGKGRLTAERFVPDPFGGRPGARLYRTGDASRVRPQGFIELLGRLDHQIKIEGLRIEPGEVEARLRRDPGVVDAAVVARRDSHGVARDLVAFVCLDPTGSPAAEVVERIRGALIATLPATMAPRRIEVLPRLPLNPNGKVDRRRLEAVAAGNSPAPTPAQRIEAASE